MGGYRGEARASPLDFLFGRGSREKPFSFAEKSKVSPWSFDDFGEMERNEANAEGLEETESFEPNGATNKSAGGLTKCC